jgi:hypothetical protein
MQWPLRVKTLELRTGLCQISMVAQQAGALAHWLSESDPVARDILKALFPRAWVGPSGVSLDMVRQDSASQLVVFATGTRLQIEELRPIMLEAAGFNPLLIMVLLLTPAPSDRSEVTTVDDMVEPMGYQRRCPWVEVNAAHYGSAQEQKTIIGRYESVILSEALGTQPRAQVRAPTGPPGCLKHILRPAEMVPATCKLGGTMQGNRGSGQSGSTVVRLG